MKTRTLLLFGVLAPLVFFSSIVVLATQVVGYSHVSQTVSEIGQTGSPVELAWTIADLATAICFLLFAWGIHRFAREQSWSAVPAWFVALYGLMLMGLAIFESPHPLHNVFGLASTVGYMAPFALALAWKDQPQVHQAVRYSWVLGVLIVVTIGLNLTPLFAPDLYPFEYYGLVQRSLFIVFFGAWCPMVALKLRKL